MNKLQVEAKSHYAFDTYLIKPRWMSYWHQIKEVADFNAKSVLIIGSGDRLVENALHTYLSDISTVDIDPVLNPSYICSVDALSKVIDRKFDMLLCCQVLEHLPLAKLDRCLAELAAVTERRCVISLPQISWLFRFETTIFSRSYRLSWVLKRKNRDFRFDGQHYWEIGAKGASIADIETAMSRHFNIERSYDNPDFTYHRFFILDKK